MSHLLDLSFIGLPLRVTDLAHFFLFLFFQEDGGRHGRQEERENTPSLLSASCSSTTVHDVRRRNTPVVFYTFFSHNGTIKRFPRIAFAFTRFPLSCAFVNNGLGSLLLMIPNGFGDPIAGFENPERQARPHTPHLTPSSFGGSATSGRRAFAFASRGHPASTSTTHGFGDDGRKVPWFYSFFHGRRPRPRARPRPRPRPRRGGGGPEVRVEVRRTDGRPPSSYTVVTVLVCVILRIRLPRARSCASSFSKSNRRRKPRPRSSSSSSSSSDGGEESGDGGEGTRGRRRGCLAATVGRPVGVVTVEVVVLVPAPALRRAVEGREGAVVVVAVVTGRGLGCLELAVVVVAVGRVWVEVTGRVWVAVVVGAVVTEGGGGGGGGAVVVVAGVVPVPATGGNVKAFKASSTLTG